MRDSNIQQKPCTPRAAAAVGPIGDRDKVKHGRVQALTVKASHASMPASTSDPESALADTKRPGQCLSTIHTMFASLLLCQHAKKGLLQATQFGLMLLIKEVSSFA